MELISLVVFIFCAGIAAGTILLTSRLMKENPVPYARPLFYHIIFMFAFGFYGIWGQFIIVTVAGSRLTPDMLSTVSVISLLLGLPFLILGWMMLLRFGAECAGLRLKGYLSVLFIVVNLVIITVIGYTSGDTVFSEALPLFKYYYSGAALFFALLTGLILLRGTSSSPGKADRRILATLSVTGALSQSAVLLLLPHSVWMALVFAFLLFAVTALLPVYLVYNAELQAYQLPEELEPLRGIEDLCIRHEISPREADIIREICNGLSNQEIADKLFISLQTVKDHTSRIYSKTNVRNRMQLMTLVQTINNGVSG
jgi:DNA-binding CsgD family transcriptional regulator